MLMLTFFTLMLSAGSLQAQIPPNCDLTKCSPEEKAECAKKCVTATTAMASLTDFLFAEKNTEKTSCNPAACQKKTTLATAKLVSTQTEFAPVYSNNLATEEEKTTNPKKRCTIKCCETKTSL